MDDRGDAARRLAQRNGRLRSFEPDWRPHGGRLMSAREAMQLFPPLPQTIRWSTMQKQARPIRASGRRPRPKLRSEVRVQLRVRTGLVWRRRSLNNQHWKRCQRNYPLLTPFMKETDPRLADSWRSGAQHLWGSAALPTTSTTNPAFSFTYHPPESSAIDPFDALRDGIIHCLACSPPR
jgi:hypothetical protein